MPLLRQCSDWHAYDKPSAGLAAEAERVPRRSEVYCGLEYGMVYGLRE